MSPNHHEHLPKSSREHTSNKDVRPAKLKTKKIRVCKFKRRNEIRHWAWKLTFCAHANTPGIPRHAEDSHVRATHRKRPTAAATRSEWQGEDDHKPLSGLLEPEHYNSRIGKQLTHWVIEAHF